MNSTIETWKQPNKATTNLSKLEFIAEGNYKYPQNSTFNTNLQRAITQNLGMQSNFPYAMHISTMCYIYLWCFKALLS